MSTLRISNIEAKADSSSPTVDEQLRFTNSDGDLMLYLDGRTAGITTVGINTTNQTIKFDANNNVMVTGIITATEFHGTLAVGTSVTYGDNEKAYFGTGLDMALYHDGNNSYIQDVGYGQLRFLSNDYVFYNAAGNENLIRITENTGVSLYDGANTVRLATTSQGIDVTGHSELDNVNISGVTTHTDQLHMPDDKIIRFGSAAASRTSIYYDVSSTRTRIRNFNDTLEIGYRATEIHYINQKRLEFINGGNRFTTDVTTTFLGDNYHASWNPSANRFQINDNAILAFGSQADATIIHNNANLLISNTTGNIDVTGNVVLNNDISVDGHTELDNVNISGVTTTSGNITANHSNGQVTLKPSDGSIEITRTAGSAYIDFKNDTSEDYDVRLNEEGGNLRTNKHFRLYDNKAIELGNRTGATYGDLRLYHDTSNSIIENFTGALYIRNYDTNSTDIVLSARNNIALQPSLNETGLQCLANGSTELFYDSGTYGTPKLRTSATGITVGGEVAATQDYPTVRPSLDLNFAATKKLDSRITYTRSGRASFTNEHGLLEIVNSNVPRFDHDPVTRECKGLLIEEARTNLLTYSNIKGMSSPNLGGNPQTNDTVNNITLPTGEKGDVRRYLAASGGGGGRWGDYSGTNNQSYTGSVWVRTVSGTTSAVIDINDGGSKTVSITEEWQRVTTTHSSNNTYRFFDIYFASPTTIYYWGVQIEEGAFVTSYIPTNNATATRGGDRVYIPINDGLDFYNPVESTILVDYTHQDGVTSSNLGTNARLYRFRATGGADTRIDYVTNTGYNPYIAKDGGAVASISHGQQTVFGGGLNRNAVRVKENSFAVSFNGSTVVEDTSGAWNPTNAIDHVTLGGMNDNYASQLSGHIQRFVYYPIGVSNSQLVTLTS